MHKVQMHAGVICQLLYGFASVRAITLLRSETPKQVLWQNSEDPDKMLHDAISIGLKRVVKIYQPVYGALQIQNTSFPGYGVSLIETLQFYRPVKQFLENNY